MVYTGQWEMDKMSGKGKLEYSNGASFNVYLRINPRDIGKITITVVKVHFNGQTLLL
jgi:hypothetical protein